jgi:hypothetical protein
MTQGLQLCGASAHLDPLLCCKSFGCSTCRPWLGRALHSYQLDARPFRCIAELLQWGQWHADTTHKPWATLCMRCTSPTLKRLGTSARFSKSPLCSRKRLQFIQPLQQIPRMQQLQRMQGLHRLQHRCPMHAMAPTAASHLVLKCQQAVNQPSCGNSNNMDQVVHNLCVSTR